MHQTIKLPKKIWEAHYHTRCSTVLISESLHAYRDNCSAVWISIPRLLVYFQ